MRRCQPHQVVAMAVIVDIVQGVDLVVLVLVCYGLVNTRRSRSY